MLSKKGPAPAVGGDAAAAAASPAVTSQAPGLCLQAQELLPAEGRV